MPSAVADPFFYRLIDSFPPHRAYAPTTFEREPMPSSVAHFLKHWLRHRLRHEATRLELPHSDWFDYEHDAVQRARRDLANALIEYGHFPAAMWEASLREAVQQVTAYLVRPGKTLAAFIFQEKNNAVSAEVLTWRLGYFKDYTYFHEALGLYLKKQDGQAVEHARLAELLRSIDQKITKDYDAEAWLTLLAPLFDHARYAGIEQGLPMPMLLAFFKDKDAEAITNRLSRHQQHRGVESLDEDGLRRLLEHTDEPVLVPAPPPVSSFAPLPSDHAHGPVPRWKQFQIQQTAPPPLPKPQPRREAPPPPAEVKRSPSPEDARPRWMQFSAEDKPTTPPSTTELRTQPAPTDLVDVERAVLGEAGAGNRNLFVTTLFAHSFDAYERILRQLHTIPSWTEASKVIAEEVFRTFQVNIYSDSAILFTDAIEARYLERKT